MNALREDCTGYEFVLGEIHGLRWWRVDRYGRLTARTYSGIWTPGEQVAECKKDEGPGAGWLAGSLGRVALYSNVWDPNFSPVFEPPKVQATEPKVEHVVPDDDCGCGFYAFTNPSYDYAGDDGDVVGVIRGYGRTLVGAHGFRCAKAEIVALCVPKPPARVSDLVPFRVSARRRKWRQHKERIQRAYDGVPIYRSVRAMLRAHPLTPTLPPAPQSDPDFWTRP